MDILIDQLNSHYDRHGTYPDTYLEMQDCPEYDSGVLPFSADDGPTSGQAVKSPEFQPSRRKNGGTYYELSFPVEVEQTAVTDGTDCVLALDAGMRKDMTAVVVTEDGEQLSTPHFIQFTDREKMRLLHRDRTRLNDRLSALRRDGHAHTDEFAHIHSEYERVNAKIQQKREQLTHDVANQVLALALRYDVDAIVHEDLRSLSAPHGEGTLSWELSSWARRDIIENIEYRAECAGLAVERVYPQGTSRSCVLQRDGRARPRFHVLLYGGL